MSKITLILLTICALSALSANTAQLIDSTNAQAVADYHNKDYDSALDKFLFIENNGIINPDLFYNIGNCYFRQSQIGLAVLYFKKALKVDPDHQAAARNLKFIQTLTKDKIDSEDNGALLNLLKNIYNSFDMNKAALITALLFLLLIVLLIVLQTAFRHRDKSLPVFLIFLVFILFSLSAVVSSLKYNKFHSSSEAVITAQTAIGFSGPGEEYTRVFTIHEGMVCNIEDQNNNWVLIKLPNGIGGWIKNSLLQTVTFKS